MKVSIQNKILILVLGIVVVTSISQLIISDYGLQSSGQAITRKTLSWKLESDLISVKKDFLVQFGIPELHNNLLVGNNGITLGSDNVFVDTIMKEYGITATIFAKKSDDFIRISTNIKTKDGKRVVNTLLDKNSNVYESIINKKTFYGDANILGIPYLTVYEPILDNSKDVVGILYLGIPMNVVDELISVAAKKNIHLQILLSVLIFVLVTLSSLILSKKIVTPIKTISSKLAELAEGEGDLTTNIKIVAQDETGQVANSFNTFVNKLRNLMIGVKNIISKTDDIKSNVSSSTTETSASIEEISANLNSIGKQIDVLDTNISDTVTSIEQITQNILSVDDQIISQSAMVQESTAAITEMMASLKNVNSVALSKKETTQALSNVADIGKERIEDTSVTFKTVVNNIKQIEEMASTINNIAAQTNLLSMNAAIEAAHAGDSGKGFAVVAEEIRKLADSAGKSSQLISQSITKITDSIFETDKNIVLTSDTFSQISTEVTDTVNAFSEIEQSVSELNIGGKQILEAINEINDISVSIRDGSGEIKLGTKNMLKNSELIKNVSGIVKNGMLESSSGAQEIVKAMELMLGYAKDLNTVVTQLQEDFGKFKTE